ncbi:MULTISPECIES: helix-turn-helix domain-containing protein [unclassified Streptomyces]|uniref:helix-turn-helix domain-containing protein n=1 Tax=unclassified Streptomyces TaxID=2593676 RepID=UPI0022B6CEDF|nr:MULTISPECIES: helix-turn-helix transcriptional regulator [unclassified Streptomyces]MCZ7417140.1 helix-turn-helix transcriptional regulator [Streptomyces sp. WMMC897]MCZ7433031.1 helix-turn-helix transcriptional regulator [Streptomyces sp. WMMC1477]
MPPRSTPTAREQRLGAELRKLRERAGMTATEAGALLGVDQARMSNIESGRVGISSTRLRTLACNYDCMDAQLVDALAGMTGRRTRQWWEEYRGLLPQALLDLAELEHYAVSMRTAQTATLPGLLQTVDHARVVFGQSIPQLPPHEVEHRTSWRIKRQAVLYGEDPAPYTAIIHEAALRMQFGGREVAKAQLRHILDMSDRENITVVVLPFEAGEYPGAGQTIFYASGAAPQLDTVQLDQSHGPVLLDAEAQLSKYRQLLDRMQAIGLDARKSQDVIQSIIKSL